MITPWLQAFPITIYIPSRGYLATRLTLLFLHILWPRSYPFIFNTLICLTN